MKFALSFLALAVLLGGCSKGVELKRPSSDDEIRQKLPGTYLVKLDYASGGNKGTTTFTPEGGLFTKLALTRSNETRNVTYEGYWQVQDGILLTTITNTDNTEVRAVIGRTNRLKIVSLDGHELVFQTQVSGLTYLRRK